MQKTSETLKGSQQNLYMRRKKVSPNEIEKFERNKLHAINELIQTERDYVKDLSYLVEVKNAIVFNYLYLHIIRCAWMLCIVRLGFP